MWYLTFLMIGVIVGILGTVFFILRMCKVLLVGSSAADKADIFVSRALHRKDGDGLAKALLRAGYTITDAKAGLWRNNFTVVIKEEIISEDAAKKAKRLFVGKRPEPKGADYQEIIKKIFAPDKHLCRVDWKLSWLYRSLRFFRQLRLVVE